MFYAELKTRRQVVLQEKKDFVYVLYEATKKETDLLFSELEMLMSNPGYKSKEFDFLDKVDFFGEVHDVNHYHVKNIIPVEKVHIIRGDQMNSKSISVEQNRCYQEHKSINPFNNIIIHEDKVSSFKCACEKAGATSFIILKELKDGEAQEKEEKEHTSDLPRMAEGTKE